MDYPAGINEAEALRYVSNEVSADLAHILQDAGVPLPVQYRITQAFKTVRRFAAYADDRPGVRTALAADISLEPADMSKRAAIAAVVAAWEACKDYSAKEAEMRAETKFLGIVRPVLQNERLAMKAAYENTHGSIEESFEPSDDYLAAKVEEFENVEPTASPLNEVTSKKAVRTQGLQTTVDKGGAVRIVKQKQRGNMPQTTEELRTVLRVEANTYCFMAGKFRNKAFFKDMSPEPWADFANYLLGEKVYLMKIPVPSTGGKGTEQTPVRPPWQVLLTYEHEIRKEAIKRAYQGSQPLAETLLAVMRDPQIKEQYFTSPIALQNFANKREWAADAPWESYKWSRGRGFPYKGGKDGKDGKDGKGGKKGGKDKGGKNPGKRDGKSEYSLMSHTADGREICFAYNAQGCSGGCGRVHVCRVRGCNQPHPLWEHFAKLSISDKDEKRETGARN